MKIPVAGLPEGIHDFKFVSTSAALELESRFGEVRVDVEVAKTDGEIHLQGRIGADLACTCDRCLGEFTARLHPSFVVHYVFRDEDADRFDPAETQVLAPGTSAINIGEDVRQVVQMAVPLKLLCKESCKGLCPQCGKNLNEGPCNCRPEPLDPRWDALRGLRSND
ncbi:MAG: DUF177 domain-containing protein [Bacteroidota bacterium]